MFNTFTEKKKSLIALTVCLLAFSNNASALLTLNFNYDDVANNTGFGFDDATFGQERRDTVEAVGNYISSVIDSDAVIDLNWNTSLDTAPGAGGGVVLGSFGQSFTATGAEIRTAAAAGHGIISNGILVDAVLSDRDAGGGGSEGAGQINFNSGVNWNSDFNTTTDRSEVDLFTVVLHEITHAFGFGSLLNSSGGARITFDSADGTPVNVYSRYDTFLRDGDGNVLVDANGVFGANPGVDASDLTSQSVDFASNSGLLDIFSPSVFQDGSSIGHLDFTTDEVLNPSISFGVEERVYGAGDLAVLSTLGFDIITVPEPSIGIMFTFGATCGLLIRRRKRV